MLWVALLLLSSCGYRSLVVRVSDETGSPVAGAVVYVEAWNNSGAYDFCFGVSDGQGRIPARGAQGSQLQASQLQHSLLGRMSVVIMADGYWPLSLVDHKHGIEPDNLFVPRLRRMALPPRPFDGAIGGGFPFLDNPRLAAKAKAATSEPLRKAFLGSFAALDSRGIRLSSEAARRWRGVQALGPASAFDGTAGALFRRDLALE